MSFLIAALLLLATVLRVLFFFFNDTATTEIYTLSLHDALPIYHVDLVAVARQGLVHRVVHYFPDQVVQSLLAGRDRKSTRLNSSHGYISYAVFCLKKKKEKHQSRADRGVTP